MKLLVIPIYIRSRCRGCGSSHVSLRTLCLGCQPGAPKKPTQLLYVLLKYTTPAWTQPVSIYLLERVDGDKVWLACRPALDLEQETLPRFQLQGEEECVCFEHVDFSKLQTVHIWDTKG